MQKRHSTTSTYFLFLLTYIYFEPTLFFCITQIRTGMLCSFWSESEICLKTSRFYFCRAPFPFLSYLCCTTMLVYFLKQNKIANLHQQVVAFEHKIDPPCFCYFSRIVHKTSLLLHTKIHTHE